MTDVGLRVALVLPSRHPRYENISSQMVSEDLTCILIGAFVEAVGQLAMKHAVFKRADHDLEKVRFVQVANGRRQQAFSVAERQKGGTLRIFGIFPLAAHRFKLPRKQILTAV